MDTNLQHDQIILADVLSSLTIRVNCVDQAVHPKEKKVRLLTNDFDVWQIVRGRQHVSVGESFYLLKPGDIFMIPPMSTFELDILEDSYYIYCHFDMMFRHVDSNFTDMFTCAVLSCENPELAAAYSERDKPCMMLNIKSALYKIIYQYFIENINAWTPSVKIHYDKNVRLLAEYIDRHISEPLTNRLLADLCGYSEKYFISWFRTQFGGTPYAYIKRKRMEIAHMLLSKYKYPVSLVAKQVGYSDPYTFSKAFRSFYGSSPSVLL